MPPWRLLWPPNRRRFPNLPAWVRCFRTTGEFFTFPANSSMPAIARSRNCRRPLACSALTELLRPGGMALFHDFNDAWNASGFYGIYQAVDELLQHPRMSFLGVIGCCALIRETEA